MNSLLSHKLCCMDEYFINKCQLSIIKILNGILKSERNEIFIYKIKVPEKY